MDHAVETTIIIMRHDIKTNKSYKQLITTTEDLDGAEETEGTEETEEMEGMEEEEVMEEEEEVSIHLDVYRKHLTQQTIGVLD